MTGRRERNKDEKRARLLAAARRLFAEQGYEATTTRQVAEAADVAAGTLFTYAPSKASLLVLVWQDGIRAAIDAGFAAAEGQPPEEALVRIFGAFLDFYAQNPALARTYVRAMTFPEPEVAATTLPFTFAFTARLAERLVASGQLRPGVDPQLAAGLCFSTYFLVLLEWLALGDLAGAHARLRAGVRLLLDGLTRETSS